MLLFRGLNLFLLATVVAVAAQPMRPVLIRGSSMSPTYADGSLLWTTPVDRPLQPGDVVIADTPEGRVIKRVALLPGDRRVQWQSRLRWEDLTTLSLPRSRFSQRRLRMLTVPSGTVFLLGDNLDRSVDSRSFGPIPIADIHRIVIDQRSPDERSGIERIVPRRWLTMGSQTPTNVRDKNFWLADELIADASHGEQTNGALGFRLDAGAEPADVNVHGASRHEGIAPPNAVE